MAAKYRASEAREALALAIARAIASAPTVALALAPAVALAPGLAAWSCKLAA